jgi:hypothetical protein
VSSSPWTSRAIAATVFPPTEASTTTARHDRTAEPIPRHTTWLQPLTLMIGQPAHPDWTCHPPA